MNERKSIESENNEQDSALNPPSAFYGSSAEALARYSHCPMCGANLHFSHVTDFIRNLTQESARCPECGLKARRIVHRLQ